MVKGKKTRVYSARQAGKTTAVAIEHLLGNLYELDDVDKELLKHLLRFKDITNAELGKIVGMTVKSVSQRRNKPAFKEAMSDMTRPIAEQIKENAQLAARRLKQVIGAGHDKQISNGFMRALELALKPFMAEEVNLNIKPIVRFSTSVQADGSLLQSIVEEDRAKSPAEPLKEKT